MNILINTFSFPSIHSNVHDGRFVFSEAMGYAKNGAHIKVITPHYPGEAEAEQLNKNITILRFRYFFPKSFQVLKKPGIPLYSQKSFLALLQIPLLCFFFALNIFKNAPWADIIHAQWTVTAFLSLPAKWILGKKIVLTARGSDLRLVPSWLNRYIHRTVDAAIDCFGPQPWNDEYKRRFPAHYITLPHMVHNDPSAKIPEDIKKSLHDELYGFVVLYVGRFDFIKLDYNKLPLVDLIRASNILKARNMKFHVYYVGGGNEVIRKRMLSLIDEYELNDYVKLLGVKTNVPDYIHFCHLGIGGIAFNAVSHEFTVNEKPQILVNGLDNEHTPWRHGINALFVKPDDQEDLADKLIWAMNHPDELKEIGKKAKEDMAQYITDSTSGGRLYLRAFSDLIGRA